MRRPPAALHGSSRDIQSWVRFRALVAVIAVSAVAFVLTPAAPASASESGTIYSLVNQSRASVGLAGLNRNAALDQVAADWAGQLAASGQLAHNPNYSAQIPGGWTNAGENVAQGQPTGAEMHDAWMASLPHRENVLGGFTDVGIAFVVAGGTTWGVEVFAAYAGSTGAGAGPAPPVVAPPVTAEQADEQVAQRVDEQVAQRAAQQVAEDAAAHVAAQSAAEAAARAATQQAAIAADAQAMADAQTVLDAQIATNGSERTRAENRAAADRVTADGVTADRLTAAMSAPAEYAVRLAPASSIAVATDVFSAVVSVVTRMLGRGPLRASTSSG